MRRGEWKGEYIGEELRKVTGLPGMSQSSDFDPTAEILLLKISMWWGKKDKILAYFPFESGRRCGTQLVENLGIDVASSFVYGPISAYNQESTQYSS